MAVGRLLEVQNWRSGGLLAVISSDGCVYGSGVKLTADAACYGSLDLTEVANVLPRELLEQSSHSQLTEDNLSTGCQSNTLANARTTDTPSK